MYNKSKNKILFVVFILIIFLIISLLIFSVYKMRNNVMEEYNVSPNTDIYDENYNYIALDKDAILKKEWDKNYYLYTNNNSNQYSLGSEPVLFDKSKKQVIVYGNIYQVFSNGDITKKSTKTVISGLDDFQFFKLNDRKYLLIGQSITSDNFSTVDYLIVSIDKAGNALLINNNVNVKTINPIVLSIGDTKFDIPNEKLIASSGEVDLKKINGSTNEYLKKDDEINTNTSENNNKDSNTSSNGNETSNNKLNQNSQIYNDIVSQIINLSGIVTGPVNKTNLYKNISLRSVNPGASYLDIAYSIIDPENRYLSVFLTLDNGIDEPKYYYLNKDVNDFRISGLLPNTQYNLKINYIVAGSSQSMVADSIEVLTSNDPTKIRINKIVGYNVYYNVKIYDEYAFSSANALFTDCNGNTIISKVVNIDNALSVNGDNGDIYLNKYVNYICLQLIDDEGNILTNNYHKIKLN